MCRVVHLFLELGHLIDVDLALDVPLYVGDIALGPTEQVADGTGHLGQALRADDHQRHDADEKKLSETDVKHGQASVFSLAWTSMVSSVLRRCVTASGRDSSCAPSLMPFLKPRTAPPRSSPMLRSFLAPKTSAMMRRTINQCQMLKLPIVSLRQAAGAALLLQGRAPPRM